MIEGRKCLILVMCQWSGWKIGAAMLLDLVQELGVGIAEGVI